MVDPLRPSGWWRSESGRLSELVRELPGDLALVIGLVLLADLVVLLDVAVAGVELRSLGGFPAIGVHLGLPLLVFLPGYAILAALYPEGNGGSDRGSAGAFPSIDRAMLSILTSVLAVGAVAVLLALSPFGLHLLPALAIISLLTLYASWVAARRRDQLPPHRRFSIRPVSELTAPLLSGSAPGLSGRGGALFLASLVLLAGVVASPLVLPPTGDGFSEAGLLAPDDAGELSAAALPGVFDLGEGQPIAVAIENHEGATTAYDVVILLQRVEDGSVAEQRELDRFALEVEDGDRVVAERRLTPPFAGDRLRLQVLVFQDGTPADPAAEAADLVLDLWISVR